MKQEEPNERVSAAREETEARGETFYPGPSGVQLAAFPPKERWDDWAELESKAWPRREERRCAARDVAVAHDKEMLHAAILFAEVGLTDTRIVEQLR